MIKKLLGYSFIQLFIIIFLSQAQASPISIDAVDLFDSQFFKEQKSQKFSSFSRSDDVAFDIPSAIYIIDKKTIQKYAQHSVVDILRTIPGMRTYNINDNVIAMSMRGFSRQYGNKMLVLVDGRSIYTQLFSGVIWEVKLPPIETIERIEVIAGAGGAIWGVNAVNGVINIITSQNLSDTGYKK